MQIEKFSVSLKIEKGGDMIYFSQLDLILILTRALRRTSLPLYYTQGFNPRVKMSFGRALKLGVAGQEEITLYFTEKIAPQELKEKLLPQMPQGLRIIEVV
ncbi:MAG: TIGR03936 family radical SAM-associated protein [Candidatus Omnitrophota bacterium]|jgi:radical SAM-linked protein